MPSTGRDLHVDVPLSNILVNRRVSGFIADQFIPVTPVDKQSNLYYKFYHGEWAMVQPGLTYRAPRTLPKKVHFNVTSDAYFAPNYALGTDWAAEDSVNADAVLNWAERHSALLMDRLMLDYEYRLAALAVNTSNVRTVSQVGCAWTLGQSPIVTQLLGFVEDFRTKTGMLPNTLIIPQAIRRHVITNSQVCGMLFGDKGGIASEQQLAGLVGIEKVLRPTVQVNTFGEQETLNGSWSFADVWGQDSIWMSHTKTLQGMETDTWINAFRWTHPDLGVPMAVERFPYDSRRKTWDMQVGYYQAEKVVSPDLAVRYIVTST